MSDPAAFGSPAALIPAPRPAELHLARLAEFLGDESPVVWREVQRHFEQAGPAARRILLQATKNTDARTRMRARHLLAQLERSAAWRRLVRYCTRSKIELEPALFLLSEWMDPDFDALSARNELDRLGARVSAQIEVRTDDLRRAGSLCDVLGREERYGGSIGEFDHPDNVLLHRALQKKAGMPLTLCALVGVLDPQNDRRGRPSLVGALRAGDLRLPVALALSSLATGLLGEFWNAHATPRWTYDVPWIGFWYVFEMPLLGFAGYPMLAAALWVVYQSVRPGLVRAPSGRTDALGLTGL